jgi:hypothetical protein
MCHLAFVSYVERKKSYHLRNTQLYFKPSEQKKMLKNSKQFYNSTWSTETQENCVL